MVRGERSEMLVQLLDASDELKRGSEWCLKPAGWRMLKRWAR
jgi:hypothetical protein